MESTKPSSLALLTDLYQLTMAYGYWKCGRAEREAVFHLFFRKNPFAGGYAIACGLAPAIEFLERLRFEPDDLAYLETLRGNDDRPLFDAGFLDYLAKLKLACDLDAIPEGTVVFPHEPLLRVRGPILACQLLESPLLNLINFQSLIATKAARIRHAAGDAPVLEFGMRRAQGVDGALAASRAAYVGGCTGTSNVLAGKAFGIPVRGTHAHSWVMLFNDELEAFDTYAQTMPNNCVFLVDTYDTLDGVRRAIEVGKRLRSRGHEMVGIRLDSGDLAYLSIEARKQLDAAGFPDATIVASNDLDEHLIASLKTQGATIGVWGVGTKLVTGDDQPALGGVYKLAAVRGDAGEWQYKVKVSEQTIKTSNPGIQQVRRFLNDWFIADMIFDVENPPVGDCTLIDPTDATHRRQILAGTPHEDLLVPIFRSDARVYDPPSLASIRDRTRAQLARLWTGVQRFENPHPYPVGLESSLHERKMNLILSARGVAT